jgi:hypothetical protein
LPCISDSIVRAITQHQSLDFLSPFVSGIQDFLNQIGMIVFGLGFILVVILLIWVWSSLSGGGR